MLRDSTVVVVVVVRTRPRAIPLAMIHMRKSIHGFPFVPLYGYGAPLGAAFGRRSSAMNPTLNARTIIPRSFTHCRAKRAASLGECLKVALHSVVAPRMQT